MLVVRGGWREEGGLMSSGLLEPPVVGKMRKKKRIVGVVAEDHRREARFVKIAMRIGMKMIELIARIE